jgi:predicted RNase H-like HicB family nuclease
MPLSKSSTVSANGIRCDNAPYLGLWRLTKHSSMKPKNSGKRALVACLCHFRPEPEGGFTVTGPKLPPVVTYGETLEQAQTNARGAIELCLEVLREDGQPIPPPDRDLASPIDQLVPVAALGS